jgi:hypothetical protein
VSDVTGGTVQRVDPLQLASNFHGILEKSAIATNVQATMLIHSGFRFRSDSAEQEDGELVEAAAPQSPKPAEPSVAVDEVAATGGEKEDQPKPVVLNRQVRDVGNAFLDTEIYFEYELAGEDVLRKLREEGLEKLPFQVQVVYKRLDGSKCIRILTQQMEVTDKRAEAEEDVDISLVAANAAKKSAQYAQQGLYNQSRAVTYATCANMSKWAHNERQAEAAGNYMSEMNAWDATVQEEQDDEGGLDVFFGQSNESRKVKRAGGRKDKVASKMYNVKSMSSNMF